MSDTLTPTTVTKRRCYHLDESMTDKDGAFRPAIVTEGERGYVIAAHTLGRNYETARLVVKVSNETLGISDDDRRVIVASSMAVG